MIRTHRQVYRISELYFTAQTQSLLQTYKQHPNGPYNLPLKFIYTNQRPTLFNRIFIDRQLANRFQLIISFIDHCGKGKSHANREQFMNIQQTLKDKLSGFVRSRPQEITVHQCDVGRAFYIQERKIYGVFYHRRLNLAKSCYSTQIVEKTKDVRYRIKGKLNRMEDMRQLQKAQEMYESQGLSRFYKDTYEGFQKSQFITRSLVKVIADLKIKIKIPDLEDPIRIGYEGPTEHIMQFQTYTVPYQEQSFAITDIDFFMGGNYHFLREKN